MLRKSTLLSGALLGSALAAGVAYLYAQSNLTGFWVLRTPRGDGTFVESYFDLKQSGDAVSGTTIGGRGGQQISDGSFKDGKLHFAVQFTGRGGQKGGAPQTFTTTYDGAQQGDKFAMTVTGGRGGRNGNNGPTTADFVRSTEAAAKPPAKLPLPALHNVPDNKLARTPPMGWNSWNKFAGRITDADVRGVADAMVASGMKKAGYEYINIDDTWELGRDANGNITSNTKFPNMKALADYVHSKGLKIGIYSSPGPKTCAGYEGSYGHEDQDAKTWAAWGIDYLKYDWCSAGQIYTDDDMQAAYQKMGDALQKSGRKIVYSLCQYGRSKVWEWGAKVGGNCWRTTGDINDSWGSMEAIGFGTRVPSGVKPPEGSPATFITQLAIQPGAAIGHWNDPDMLEVGNGRMTTDEYRTHFALWCMLRAPLLAGNDLRDMSDDTKSILMNAEVIAINQDPGGMPLKPITETDTSAIYSRPLKNGDLAVAMFNRGAAAADLSVKFADLGVAGKKLTARDLWKHEAVTLSGDSYSASVPSHGVVMLRVTAK